MERNEIIFEVLEATGLNWTVHKKPLFFNDEGGGTIDVPDTFATVRNDTSKVVGVVGKQYSVMQNSELVETVYDAGEKVFTQDLKIQHPWNNAETLGTFGNIAGGSLKEGSAVFVQMQLPEVHIGRSGMKRYITATNRHDGNASLGFGTANQVICCANTFAIANREIPKFRHTQSLQERVDGAVKAIKRILSNEEKELEIFHEASKIPFSNKHLEEVMGMLFGKDKIHDPNASTRLKNQVKDFAGDVETSIVEQGETLWALFNAVTRYTNHTRQVKDKDYSLLFGTDAKINNNAFKLLSDWVTA